MLQMGLRSPGIAWGEAELPQTISLKPYTQAHHALFHRPNPDTQKRKIQPNRNQSKFYGQNITPVNTL